MGSSFTIRTDHHSLKNLLNQFIKTPEKQYFLSKLLRYSYSIVYKKGQENVTVDALSRLPTEEGKASSNQLWVLESQPLPEWLDQLKQENTTDEWLGLMRQQIINQLEPMGFTE